MVYQVVGPKVRGDTVDKSVFRDRLKTFLFRRSFPWLSTQLLQYLHSDSRHLRTLKSFKNH